MAVSKLILGLNARNFLYINRFNRASAKELADDKLATKRLLEKHDIPTPKLIAPFISYREARSFDWSTLPETFVLKPARGFGGEGIRVISGWNGTAGLDERSAPVTIDDLEGHIFDILDGAFSLDNLPDTAFIEDKVIVSSTFRKMSLGGVPDVRVIVCNHVPIMAMLRLPTEESHRKANLHLGALGIGIDLRTGITIRAIQNGREVIYVPGQRTKSHGIKIPHWDKILHISAKTQAVSKLGYAGIDVVLDERHGPQVLEINARPGLSIQLANGASLRTRLERVEALKIPTPENGVDLAKKLFAEPDLAEIHTEHHVLHVIEKVQLIGNNGKRKTVNAKIDTGAYRTSIDAALVDELELKPLEERVRVESGTGIQHRTLTTLSIKLRGTTRESIASFTDRSHMRFPIIIGRRDLAGFLVDPSAVQPHVQ